MDILSDIIIIKLNKKLGVEKPSITDGNSDTFFSDLKGVKN